MLPLSKNRSFRENGHYSHSTYEQTFAPYFRRIFNLQAMDWQYAAWQMVQLVRNPSKVHGLIQKRKQTRNQWARDDPGFMVLQVAFLVVCIVAYTVALGPFSIGTFLRLLVHAMMQYLVYGFIVCTICRTIANQHMRVAVTPHSVEQQVEWLYAFDVHANAFWILFVGAYVGQFLLLPIILSHHTFIGTLIGNLLYLFSFGGYWYFTFAGYLVLPFLHRTNMFLYPILITALTCIVCTVINVNLPKFILSFFFFIE